MHIVAVPVAWRSAVELGLVRERLVVAAVDEQGCSVQGSTQPRYHGEVDLVVALNKEWALRTAENVNCAGLSVCGIIALAVEHTRGSAVCCVTRNISGCGLSVDGEWLRSILCPDLIQIVGPVILKCIRCDTDVERW